jgi:hypothetical protein
VGDRRTRARLVRALPRVRLISTTPHHDTAATRYTGVMRWSFVACVVLLANGCTLPGSAGPNANGAPGATDDVARAAEHCDPAKPLPEEQEIDHVLAREFDSLSGCLDFAYAQYTYVRFVIDRAGHARDVRVNGETQGALARCVARSLYRLVFRPPSACPTSAEFVIADSPFSGKGTGSRP